MLMVDILREVTNERTAQDIKFGNQSDKTLAQWHAILTEETGEVSKEVCELLHGGGDRANLRTELIQVAAVAVAFIQHGDYNDWWE